MKKNVLILLFIMTALLVSACGKADVAETSLSTSDNAVVFFDQGNTEETVPNAEGCVGDGLTY